MDLSRTSKLQAENEALRRQVTEQDQQLAAVPVNGTAFFAGAEQSLLAAIVESSDDVIISKDLNGIIRSWNRGAERIFGYTAEEIIGKPVTILAVPERIDEIPNILERIKQGERIDHYETQRRTKDGRVLTVSLTVSPIRTASGTIIGASKVARDITDYKRAAEYRERLAAIVESSDDAIISKDLNGIIRSWNKGAERIFGYTAEEIIGRPVTVLAVPERVEEIPNILARIQRGERVDHYETKRQTKDGRVLTISLTVSPIRDGSGTIIGASKVARDITALKQAEEERSLLLFESQLAREALTRSNIELRRANEALEQFAFSASHDLKEPLRMVSIYCQMLQRKCRGKFDAEMDEYVQFAVDGAKRMELLVGNLLAYTQAVSLSKEPSPSVSASAVLEQTLKNLRGAIEETGARIESEPLPMLLVPEVSLLQLFQNLVGNAIKYHGDAPPVIQVSAEQQNGMWRLCVRDNGIGIDPEYHEQIFGIFKRLHTSDAYQGTGVGLAICQKIVERYGGRIWVESKEGQGSRFYFTLPGADSTDRENDPNRGC